MTREHGFTLPEVLVASLIGFIVLAAVLGLLESTVRLSSGVMAKTDAMQRGRLAMDRITQQLRSQICLGVNSPAVAAGDTRSITFYADFGDGDDPLQRRVLTMNPNGNIVERVYVERAPLGAPYDFPTAPTRSNTVLENAAPVSGKPFLRYWAFPVSGDSRTASVELSATPQLVDTSRVARIEVAFISRPTRATDGDHGVMLRDQVVVRHADPNIATPDPACT